MSKVNTIAQLEDLLDKELAWRTKEIATVKLALKSPQVSQSTILRAGLALLYAHWEGFVKSAATAYIAYVSSRTLKYAELCDCFVAHRLRSVAREVGSANSIAVYVDAVKFLRNSASEEALLFGAVDTKSNLNFEVLVDVFRTIGLRPDRYETHRTFIDTKLLKKRNEIAHGEYVFIDRDDFFGMADQVLTLIKWVDTDIRNMACAESFRHPQSVPLQLQD